MSDDISVYADHLNELLRCEIEDMFDRLYDDLSVTWSNAC